MGLAVVLRSGRVGVNSIINGGKKMLDLLAVINYNLDVGKERG